MVSCIKRTVTGLAAVLMGTALFSGPAHAQARHVLAEQGQVRCEVVVPPEAGPVAQFAGKELQQFLAESFGAPVELLTAPSGAKTALVLGRGKLLEEAGVEVDAIARDGFVIKSMGANILIAGRDDMKVNPEREMATSSEFMRNQRFERGTLYGAYEFLERFLGVRFYFPGTMGTVVPKHDALAVDALDLSVKPDHSARDMGYSGKLPDGTDGPATYPFKSLHKYRLRAQTEYIPNCHGLRELDLVRRFGESNPEYFALMGDGKRYNNPNQQHPGQLCFSSGVREVIYQDAKAYLTGQPAESRNITARGRDFRWARSAFQPGYFNLMPQDGLFPCHCPECQKHFKGLRYREIDQKAASEFIWGLVCDVAERLKAEGVPGAVTAMAYSAYRDIPQRAIPDNVLVMVAQQGPWNARGYEKELALIKGWRDKINKKVWLWSYVSKHGEISMPGIPCMTPKAVGRYYKLMAPYIFGAYIGSTSDRYLYQYLNQYVAHKIFWDDSVDVDALLAEHYQKMFGAAAPTMQAIYERLEETWLTKVAGNLVETDLGPTAIPPSSYELWEKIYTQKEIDTLEGFFNEAEQRAQGDDLDRVRFMRMNLLDPLKEERGKYVKTVGDVADLQFAVTTMPKGQTIVLDGALNDKAWAACEPIVLRPFPASKGPGPKTLVRLLKDVEHLYVAFDCEEPKMDKLVSSERPRDAKEIFRDSSVEVFLNPTADRKHYRQIIINASGSITDIAAEKLGSGQKYDWDWASNARVAVQRRADGWSAEIAIPMASLGEHNAEGFPANFNRNRRVSDEPLAHLTWSPFLKQGFHEIENFGRLVFNAPASANLVQNGNFTAEVKGRSFGGWSHHMREGNDEESWKLDTTEFISGGQSLRIKSRGQGDHVAVRQSLPGLKPNTTYRMTFFVKVENIVPAVKAGGVRIALWDEKNLYFPPNPYIGTIPWSKQGFTFKTSANINKGPKSYIALTIRDAAGTAWFDEVEIVEAPE